MVQVRECVEGDRGCVGVRGWRCLMEQVRESV